MSRLIFIPLFFFSSLTFGSELTKSQETHIWNLFKLRDVYIAADISDGSNGSLLLIEGSDRRVQVSVTNKHVILLVPVKSGWSMRILIHRRSTKKGSTHLIIAFAGSDVVVFEECNQIFSEQHQEVDFRFDEVKLTLLPVWNGTVPTNLKIDSGFPVSQRCPNISRVDTEHHIEHVEKPDHQTNDFGMTYFSARVMQPPKDFEGCLIDDTYVKVGGSFSKNCTTCTCISRDDVHCKAEVCKRIACKSYVQQPGDCCPRCARECMSEDDESSHDHGEAFWPDDCARCSCNDGVLTCHIENRQCLPLQCSETDRIEPTKYQCCPRCKDYADFCSHSKCHKDSDCINERHQAKCVCKEGFSGNGTYCEDINECKFSDDVKEQLGGCLEGTFCFNTKGSFKCECYPGFQRLSERLCIPLLRV